LKCYEDLANKCGEKLFREKLIELISENAEEYIDDDSLNSKFK